MVGLQFVAHNATRLPFVCVVNVVSLSLFTIFHIFFYFSPEFYRFLSTLLPINLMHSIYRIKSHIYKVQKSVHFTYSSLRHYFSA